MFTRNSKVARGDRCSAVGASRTVDRSIKETSTMETCHLCGLPVEIRMSSGKVKVIYLDDLREAFCREFNDLNAKCGTGATAYPVSSATRDAAVIDRSA